MKVSSSSFVLNSTCNGQLALLHVLPKLQDPAHSFTLWKGHCATYQDFFFFFFCNWQFWKVKNALLGPLLWCALFLVTDHACLLAACYESNRFSSLRAPLLRCTPLSIKALPAALFCPVEFKDCGTGATPATDFTVNNKAFGVWPRRFAFSVSIQATVQG